MRYWLELRTALALSRLGTVSATAREIGVHRATINRHIDILEAEFRTRMFQRHKRGYALTESGREIVEVAEKADLMFADLQARQRSLAGLTSGTLKITAVEGLAPQLMPVIKSFQLANPQVKIEFLAEANLLQLETGDAHIAFRSGPAPEEPDYVVRPFRQVKFALYASHDYLDRHGPLDLTALEGHRFVAHQEKHAYPTYQEWFSQRVPDTSIVLKSGNRRVREIAVCLGVGIGFIDEFSAACTKDLVEVGRPGDGFGLDMWVVTHVDLHRTPNVSAFLSHLSRSSDGCFGQTSRL